MAYVIACTERFLRQLNRLSDDQQAHVERTMEGLETEPRPKASRTVSERAQKYCLQVTYGVEVFYRVDDRVLWVSMEKIHRTAFYV